MTETADPVVKIKKTSKPTIYLDSNIFVELAKLGNGTCSSVYKRQISALYCAITLAKQKQLILCPIGNQQAEIGVSKAREVARQFLYSFTNADLLHPAQIKEKELDISYNAFKANSETIDISGKDMFSDSHLENMPLALRLYTTYEKEKLDRIRNEKSEFVETLNEAKQYGRCHKDFESQLNAELGHAKENLLSVLLKAPETEADVIRRINTLGPIFSRIGSLPQNDDYILKMAEYLLFLNSPYYRLTPYVWIECNLWAHRLQSDKKIVQGDYMDTIWAAAYLPFVDYFLTDDAFCRLLNESGLAEQYGARVYSLKTIDSLLIELFNIYSDCQGN